MKKLNLLLIGILFFCSNALLAQEKNKLKQHYPISISIMDESVSIPNFWFLKYSYEPALMIGTEYILKEKKNYDLHLTANIGGYYSKEWQGALFVNSEIGYRYHLKQWNIAARFGLGYAHIFETNPVYKNVDGTFQQVSNSGSPSLMTSLGLRIGYQLKAEETSPEIFLNFMNSIEMPIFPYSSVHQFVGIGVKFYPFN